jgi:hypothetical protein
LSDRTEKVIVSAIGLYDGHATKKNKSVDLKFKFSYDERINVVKAIAFVGQNISVQAKKGNDKPVSLGTFSFQELKIDRDGETILKLNSELDYVYSENINSIVGDDLLKIRLSADIIIEE